MVPRHKLPKSIPLHGQKLNYISNVCELEDHVGENKWSLNWLTKLGPAKKTPLASFPNHLLKNAKSNPRFPMACHLAMNMQSETPLG